MNKFFAGFTSCLLCLLFLFGFSNYLSSAKSEQNSILNTYHEIANSYFRMGEQATLCVRLNYPKDNMMIIDDPRIFEMSRKLNGSLCGLDTNNWANANHMWTLIKD